MRGVVTRLELPRHLPGYITVVMAGDGGATFATDVIETDESEAFFTAGAEVEIVIDRDDDGTEAIHTPWVRYGKIMRNRTRRLPSP